MTYFANAGQLLLSFVFGALIGLFVLRLLAEASRVNFRNPISQLLYRYSNPVVAPLRRIVPNLGRLNLAAERGFEELAGPPLALGQRTDETEVERRVGHQVRDGRAGEQALHRAGRSGWRYHGPAGRAGVWLVAAGEGAGPEQVDLDRDGPEGRRYVDDDPARTGEREYVDVLLAGQPDPEAEMGFEVPGVDDLDQVGQREGAPGGPVRAVAGLVVPRRAGEPHLQPGVPGHQDRAAAGIADDLAHVPDGPVGGQRAAELEDQPVEAGVMPGPDLGQGGDGPSRGCPGGTCRGDWCREAAQGGECEQSGCGTTMSHFCTSARTVASHVQSMDRSRRAARAKVPGLGPILAAIALSYVVVNLITDLLYGAIDPRVRLR